jgi:hypothetical protein
MPIQQKQVLRYRGTVRTILRKLREVIRQIEDNEQRYPEPPTNRRRLAFSPTQMGQLTLLSVRANDLLAEKWPPTVGSLASLQGGLILEPEDDVPL